MLPPVRARISLPALSLMALAALATMTGMATPGCDSSAPPAADAGADAGEERCEERFTLEDGDPTGHAAPLSAAAGQSFAGRLSEGDLPADPAGLLTWEAGDFVLANDRVAAVIEAPGASDGFYGFGGGLVGLARMEGGAMVEPADFGEVIYGLGRFGVSPEAGGAVTVLSDGSDGSPAVVRVRGMLTPTPFIDELAAGFYPEDFSGLEAALDYTLRPDSERVEISVTLSSTRARDIVVPRPLLLFLQQNRMPVFAPEVGFTIPGGRDLPYVAFIEEGATSYAWSSPSGPLSLFLEISNIAFYSPPPLRFSACAQSTLAVARVDIGGPGLDGLLEARARSEGESLRELRGSVTEPSGAPAAGVRVHAMSGPEVYLGRALSAEDGSFTLHLPEEAFAAGVQLSTWRRGEAPIAPFEVPAGGGPVALTTTPSAFVEVQVRDADGAPVPARIQALPMEGEALAPPPHWGEAIVVEGRHQVAYAPDGHARMRLPVGPSLITASRGYEYSLDTAEVTLTEGDSPSVELSLDHVVDTPGVLCGDFHLHTSRSFDTQDPVELKVRGLLAEGVEIGARSDHDWVGSFEPQILDLRAADQVYGVSSLELTTFTYGHFGVFPIEADPSQPSDGRIVWEYQSPSEIFDAVEARAGAAGAPEVIVNHPREGVGITAYFLAAGYDPDTGEVRRPELWDDRFRLLEAFNESDFDHNLEGTVRDWFSFLNRGVPVMAVGSSDSHQVATKPVGYPRTCIELDADNVRDFRLFDTMGGSAAGMVRDRMVAGRSVISGGIYVEAEVGGQGPGRTATGVGDRAELSITARAPLWVGADRLRVYVDGALHETLTLDASTADPLAPVIRFDDTLEVPVAPEGSWVIVVVDGEGDLSPVHPGRRPFGVTNPIFLER